MKELLEEYKRFSKLVGKMGKLGKSEREGEREVSFFLSSLLAAFPCLYVFAF